MSRGPRRGSQGAHDRLFVSDGTTVAEVSAEGTWQPLEVPGRDAPSDQPCGLADVEGIRVITGLDVGGDGGEALVTVTRWSTVTRPKRRTHRRYPYDAF